MTTRANISTKQAWLNTDFGRDYAMRVFGLTLEQLEAIVGRYKRGARVGQLRGKLVWLSVESGGWVRMGNYDHDTGSGNGFVAKPGVRFAHSIYNFDGECLHGDGCLDPQHNLRLSYFNATNHA